MAGTAEGRENVMLVSSIPASIPQRRHRREDSERTARKIGAALSAAAVFAVVVALVSSNNQSPAALSETFGDGPDPDAPTAKQVQQISSILSAPAQSQKLVEDSMSDVPESESGFTIDRLQRVIQKIHYTESEYEGIETKRQGVINSIDKLYGQLKGLTIEANDAKQDLVKYSEDQRSIVAQLEPPQEVSAEPVEGEMAPEGGEEPGVEAEGGEVAAPEEEVAPPAEAAP